MISELKTHTEHNVNKSSYCWPNIVNVIIASALHDNNDDSRYELLYLEYVHLRKYKVKGYDIESFLNNRYNAYVHSVRPCDNSMKEHPLSRFIFYSLDFYEIVNHALWYYYIAYLVYCYCYVTTTKICNATRLSIFTSTFLYLSSSLHME